MCSHYYANCVLSDCFLVKVGGGELFRKSPQTQVCYLWKVLIGNGHCYQCFEEAL